MALLTEAQKRGIYIDVEFNRKTKAQVARDYGVSPRTIGRVVKEEHATREDFVAVCENCDIDDEEVLEEIDLEYSQLNEFEWEDFDIGEEEPEVESEYHVVATGKSLSITKISQDSDPRTVTIDSANERFEEASEIVWSNRASQESLETAFELIDKKTFIEKYTNGNITVDPEVGRVYYKINGYHQEFSGRLVPRLITAVSNGEQELNNLINFAERLACNPSSASIEDLYNFLEAACIDIDKDGCVIAFKKVRIDFFDIHSGTMDNSPGKTVEVPRNMVDDDSSQTCSYGLHVCSSSYLPNFGSSSSNRVVKVKVDPRDFVAVPRDYNDAKARVCRYEVLEEIFDY